MEQQEATFPSGEAIGRMSSLAQAIGESLVNDSDAVRVVATAGPGAVFLWLGCADGDEGTLIGKQGRLARSMRTILGAAAAKLQVRCELNIQDGRTAR